MKNPLEQFVPVEDRADGIYVKIDRTLRDSLKPEIILTAMKNSIVMNFDATNFKDVFSRARGAFEKIGPPFEYYDSELDLSVNVSISPQKASLKISENYFLKGKKVTVALLTFCLKRKGVINGIDTNALIRICIESIKDQYVDVAFATPPENGTDGRIEFKKNISPEIKPKQRGDGSVDYRNIQTFTSVAKGELLAVKYPPGPGVPGVTVTGDHVPATPGKDIQLPQGKNTEISPDGMQLIANATGIIFFEGTVLTIAELLHINNDVDFSVGNIKYTGDVLIGGSVKPGFCIEAEGSIQIKGEVESAIITSRAGRVIIDKGVMGKGDTTITAKEGINCNFAQETNFKTEGPMEFSRYLLHCKVDCDTLDGTGHDAGIIGGEVRARKSISVKCCGSDNGAPTKVCIYDKNKGLILEKVKELTALHEKLSAELEPIERQLKAKAALMKRMGDSITDRGREEVKKWVDAYNGMKKKCDFVAGKIKELESASRNTGDRSGFIQVFDKCYTGTSVVLYDIPYQVKTMLINKKLKLNGQTVTIEGTSQHDESK
ncbi:MAG: DUF342 domain-containing protein [Chitinispirillaceae bacterium]|nr:DUF342 domain-containing protein [Chitinispirillaceae bacterium]